MILTSFNNKKTQTVRESAKLLSENKDLEIIFNHFLYGDVEDQFSMSDEQLIKNIESKRFLLAKIEDIFGDTDEQK